MIIMRHGEAGWDQGVDSDRTLTDRGVAYLKEQRQAYAQYLSQVDKVICSPYIRTRQTLELILDGLNILDNADAIHFDDRITPDVSIEQALQALEHYWSGNLLVVTHQPLIGNLVSFLVDGPMNTPEPVMPGQIFLLDMEWPAAGMATRLPY